MSVEILYFIIVCLLVIIYFMDKWIKHQKWWVEYYKKQSAHNFDMFLKSLDKNIGYGDYSNPITERAGNVAENKEAIQPAEKISETY